MDLSQILFATIRIRKKANQFDFLEKLKHFPVDSEVIEIDYLLPPFEKEGLIKSIFDIKN